MPELTQADLDARRELLYAVIYAYGPVNRHRCDTCGHTDGAHDNDGVCEVDGCECRSFE